MLILIGVLVVVVYMVGSVVVVDVEDEVEVEESPELPERYKMDLRALEVDGVSAERN